MQLWNPKYSHDVGKYMLKWAGFWCCMVTVRPRSEFNTLYIPFHSNDICLGTMGAPRSSTAIFTSFLRSDSCFILEGTRRKRAQKLCIVRLFFFLIMVSRACFVLFWIQCFEFNLRFTKNTAFWKTGNVQRSSPVTMKWSAMGSSSAVSSPLHF